VGGHFLLPASGVGVKPILTENAKVFQKINEIKTKEPVYHRLLFLALVRQLSIDFTPIRLARVNVT
jgi:hypothetical protein